ncbi:hypothetical protein JTB14_009672 [Gonioctena quinquepunctata]|nr:hypothetical protein JTB14_009672 [Gonioctena quinquepunctata]
MKRRRKSSEISRQSGLSNGQAFSSITDANLSTHQYDIIRKKTIEINKEMYPTYHEVKAAKQLCYPNEMTVTETYSEVKLQSLMHHTIERLCKVQEEVLKTRRDSKKKLFR